MDIAVVGPDPASEALRAAFADVDVNVMTVEPDLLDGFDFAAVVGTAGDGIFRAANAALDRWVAVEVGGIGGHAFEELDAAVTLFDSESGCYACLRDRVAANLDPEDEVAEPRGIKSAVRYAGALAGRRAIRYLSGEAIAGTVAEVPGTVREFLPSPGCGCGPVSEEFQLSHRTVALDHALDRAERAVDERVGVLRNVGERESFPLPYYVAATADTSPFSDARCAEFAAGVAPDWDTAFMKALGEGLERYAAGVYRTDGFREAPSEALEVSVSVDRFVRPDTHPTPAPTDAIRWVRGRELGTGDQAWLPAEFVVFPPPTERYAPAITTGLGLGNSTIEAVLAGLYETIERDAIMLAWYSTFDPLGLEVTNSTYQTVAARARSEGLTATALLVTQDVDVPVVAAAVHRDADWPRFAAGSAADLDPGTAAADALTEALQNWIELRAMGPEQATDEEGAIGEHASFSSSAREFFTPDATVSAESVGGNAPDESDEPLSGTDELDAVLSRLDATELEAYAARLTTRDLDGLGFEAVRTLVPGAQPLFTGDPFFGDRLGTVTDSMGFDPRPDRPFHPFP